VGADQAVGAGAADEERAGEQPEVAAARRAPEDLERDRDRVAGAAGGDRIVGRGAVGVRPTSVGRSRMKISAIGMMSSAAPLTTTSAQRQPGPAASRARTGRNRSWPVAVAAVRAPRTTPPPLAEPPGGDDGAQDVGDHAAAGTDDQAPQHDELPRGGDLGGGEDRDREQRHRERHQAPHAQPLGECGAELAGEAVEQEVDRDRKTTIAGDQPKSCSSGFISTLGVAGWRRRRGERQTSSQRRPTRSALVVRVSPSPSCIAISSDGATTQIVGNRALSARGSGTPAASGGCRTARRAVGCVSLEGRSRRPDVCSEGTWP